MLEWRGSNFRRMMSKRCLESKILTSDKFQSLPVTTKLLYIYLIFEADNYGFLASAQGTISRIGATKEDLERLIINDYILPLSKDVYCIVHWFIHNKEDKRLTPDFQEIELVELKNKQYVLKNTALVEDGKYHYLPSDT